MEAHDSPCYTSDMSPSTSPRMGAAQPPTPSKPQRRNSSCSLDSSINLSPPPSSSYHHTTEGNLHYAHTTHAFGSGKDPLLPLEPHELQPITETALPSSPDVHCPLLPSETSTPSPPSITKPLDVYLENEDKNEIRMMKLHESAMQSQSSLPQQSDPSPSEPRIIPASPISPSRASSSDRMSLDHPLDAAGNSTAPNKEMYEERPALTLGEAHQIARTPSVASLASFYSASRASSRGRTSGLALESEKAFMERHRELDQALREAGLEGVVIRPKLMDDRLARRRKKPIRMRRRLKHREEAQESALQGDVVEAVAGEGPSDQGAGQ